MRRPALLKVVAFLAVLSFASHPLAAGVVRAAAAAEEPSIAGHWAGEIELPGTKLEFDIDFTLGPDGAWSGDISIPLQNAKDLPLVNIAVKGQDVSFEISGVPGAPAFKGTLSDDGLKMSGQFVQGEQAFPFVMSRSAGLKARAKQALAGFDEIVAKGLEGLKVPGIALAIVVEDEVVLAKGYGFKDLENKVPMTADTLLAIGSSSKAFTVFALGTLVDEGKLDWDKPLRTYIPWFKLYDSFAAERLTPRDTVTHRSGLPRHDLSWYNNTTISREDLVRRLAYLKPTADLRAVWQYNNLMYLTAGYLVEILTGKTWEDGVRAQVLEPLGMRRTNFSVEDSQKDADFALPYREHEGKIEKVPFRGLTNMGPAGSINSSVNEMSRWVLVHLNGGKLGDEQIINPQTIQDMHLVHMPTGGTPEIPEVTPANYGMGWFVDSYRGHGRIHHGGNIDGFSAMVGMLPRERVGFVALANKNATGLPELLIRHATDLILGLEVKDWVGEAAKSKVKGDEAAKEAEKKKAARRLPGTKPSHKLEDFAGDYFHPGYGDLKVTVEKGGLAFIYNDITTPLEHWHYDVFSGLRGGDPVFENFQLNFITDANGNIARLEAPMEATLEPIVFEKKPDARLSDPAYLQRFVGEYLLIEQVITISLKGNVLFASVPGASEMELVPGLGDEFTLKQVKVASIRFKMDDKGNVTAMELSQPGGVFEAKRQEK
ncbi:MAG: serine hydrolase [Candidatus Aminicenantes bacterium]|nr:serine hydrolase [Candidatus Aminicenantes bacterium]